MVNKNQVKKNKKLLTEDKFQQFISDYFQRVKQLKTNVSCGFTIMHINYLYNEKVKLIYLLK